MSAMDAWITAVTCCATFLLSAHVATADRDRALAAALIVIVLAAQWWVLS